MLTRREFASAATAAAFAAPASQRNVLLLVTDQQTVGALSANGNRHVRTPAMDSIAGRGVSFTESYCAYPVCSPSRGSIFTGRMPHETGVRLNGESIDPGIPTLGEIFRKAGYRAAYGGKWHVPKTFDDPRGFEALVGGNRLGQRMDEPLADACVRFLSEKQRQPFLLAASFMNPHDICDWIRDHPGPGVDPAEARHPPVPGNLGVDPDEPEFIQYHRRAGYDLMSQAVGIASKWSLGRVRAYLAAYYRLVEGVDGQIARVLKALDDNGLRDNTIVLLTSDHGEGMGAHRWVQKAAFWEPAAKVPFLIAGPGIGAGAVDQRTLVSGIDVAPTLCDYAGVRAPENARGKSLRPALEGKRLDRPFLVSELLYGSSRREGRMLRSSRHKYVAFNGGARPEQLFDLELDPGEVYDLARRPEAKEELGRHRALLRGWIAETADDFST